MKQEIFIKVPAKYNR